MKTHVMKLLAILAFLVITPLSMPVLAETFSPCGKVFTSTFPTGWATDSNQTLTFTFSSGCGEVHISAEKPHRPLVVDDGTKFHFDGSNSYQMRYMKKNVAGGIVSLRLEGVVDNIDIEVSGSDTELLITVPGATMHRRLYEKVSTYWFAGTGFDEKRR